MRILHCSDVHLGRRPVGAVGEYSQTRFNDYFNAFANVVDFAINNKIDVFMIAGDFFDKREISPDILHKAEILLEKLKTAKIRTLICEGNHDNIQSGYEKDSWIVYLSQKGLLERPHYTYENELYIFYPIEIENCRFYGLGYSGIYTEEAVEALANHIEANGGKQNILLVHTAIADSEKVSGTVSSDCINKLQGSCDYIAGGHLHSHKVYPSESPFFFLPGSLEYFDLGEIGQKKGFIVYDTESKNYQWHKSNARAATNIKFSSSAENFEQFQNEFIEMIDKIDFTENMLIKMIISTNKNFMISTHWCETELDSRGALKSQIKISMPSIISDGNDSAFMSVEQIEESIFKTWDYFGDYSEESVRTLQKLKEYQRESQMDMFFEEFDSLLNNIINNSEGSDNENQ